MGFCLLNYPCIHGMKPTCSWWMILSVFSCIGLECFIEYFMTMFRKEIVLTSLVLLILCVG